MNNYIVKEKEGEFLFSDAIIVENPDCLKLIDHPLRLRILRLLAKKPMYPAELAKELKLHEQKVYYHIKQMVNSGLLQVTQKKEIRGTIAKKFSPKYLNFAVTLSNDWKRFSDIVKPQNEVLEKFLNPFISGQKLNSHIVVGSPDPHGPHKARARDGHYAIDLSIFLGRYCSSAEAFSSYLDVEIDLKIAKHLVLVGGPVTNILVAKLNDFFPAKFSDSKPWGILSKTKTYTEESVGMICRIPNPYQPENLILVLAGIRYIGTKAAVLALTQHTDEVLYRFSGQKEFYTIVQGFDMNADGKIDTVEILE